MNYLLSDCKRFFPAPKHQKCMHECTHMYKHNVEQIYQGKFDYQENGRHEKWCELVNNVRGPFCPNIWTFLIKATKP